MSFFNYEFEELPLVIAGTIEAAIVNGRAKIEYRRDGGWQIKSIEVEGYLPLTLDERAAGKKPWVYIPAPAVLEQIIADRLGDEWHDKVQGAVSEQIAEDREDAAEYRAEQRREDRMLEQAR